MSSVLTFLQGSWSKQNPDAATKENWEGMMDVMEKDRQRDRILAWRDRTGGNDFAAICNEAETYKRSAVFVWRTVDPIGAQKARSHQYLYNLEVYGHKVYSRRSAQDIAAAHKEVERRVTIGELGPLSPLD